MGTCLPPPRRPMPRPGLARRVAFLADPRHHLAGTREVRVIETHRSYVFLTDAHAYKLKKSARGPAGTPGAREAQCRREVELNRRLSDDVYLGVIPVTLDAAREMRLGGEGPAVDWLVWMRRLPEAQMLDSQIRAGHVDMTALRACVRRLVKFQRAQPGAAMSPARWRDRTLRRTVQGTQALLGRGSMLDRARVERLAAAQRAFVAGHGSMLEARVRDGRIVEGHGDLRPEHVCLSHPPQLIDCLDFSRELRIADGAGELAFLALECERLGAPHVAEAILETYRAASRDAVPPALVHFYQALHAAVRGGLAIAHLREPGAAGVAAWQRRAADYLSLAERHMARAAQALIPA